MSSGARPGRPASGRPDGHDVWPDGHGAHSSLAIVRCALRLVPVNNGRFVVLSVIHKIGCG